MAPHKNFPNELPVNLTKDASHHPQKNTHNKTHAAVAEILDIRGFGDESPGPDQSSGGTASPTISETLRNDIISSFLKLQDQANGKDTTGHGPKALQEEEAGERTLPTLLLYDTEGLKLFEKITYLDEYYLTGDEIEVLTKWASKMAERILDMQGAASVGGNGGGEDEEVIIVELGSGNLRKVSVLLLALLQLLQKTNRKPKKKVTYYALDVSLPELQRTFSQVPTKLIETDLITLKGLHATYDDGLKWLATSPDVKDKKKCILWLGSSIGNFDRADAASFLASISRDVLKIGDTMLIGIDGCKKPLKVWAAYNDKDGVTRDFILNGLKHANSIIGGEAFKPGEWEYVGEWNEMQGRHQAFYVAVKDLIIDGILFDRPGDAIRIRRGERVRIERSYKYSEAETKRLWEVSGLVEGVKWGTHSGEYKIHMVYKSPFEFKLSPQEYAPLPYPTVLEWKELWKAWDTVTLGMIPRLELNSKPIDLRNPCIFYIGHIPTFLDMHIARATATDIVGPERYPRIFERGIDPDVENPDNCHRHSEIPETWPELEEILTFQRKLRGKVERLYGADGRTLLEDTFKNDLVKKRRVQRALWMTFEHEAMHLETLLYMLIQSNTALPPPGVVKPDFEAEYREGSRIGTRRTSSAFHRSSLVRIPEQSLTVGMDDPEDDDFTENPIESRFFGWDNEKPLRSKPVTVKPFLASSYPITNGDYLDYLLHKSSTNGNLLADLPATWRRNEKGDISVKTVFGLVPLDWTLNWPVIASYDELVACANYYGGRIPTADEVHAIYKYASQLRKGSVVAEKVDARRIDAVNGHLSMNGVRESPPSPFSASLLEKERQALFEDFSIFSPSPSKNINSNTKNMGFQRWCLSSTIAPSPPSGTSHSSSGSKDVNLCGRCELGGAWEWTSTVLDRHEGFVEGKLYPEYTSDFFDTKHNIVLGGSWATHPRIAGRKTFVNWYQRNYRYTWCTARVVQDL